VKPWLVVEDETDIRTIVTVLFTAWGYTPMEFKDGHEAYRWLDDVEAGTYNGELPEIALMDIRMPGHFGTDIARRMRAIDALKNLPIVLMTAFPTNDPNVKAVMENNVIDHIINKPLPEMFELKAILENVRSQKQQV